MGLRGFSWGHRKVTLGLRKVTWWHRNVTLALGGYLGAQGVH